jgi:rare lipoprotein A
MNARLPRLGSLFAVLALTGCAVPHGATDDASTAPLHTDAAVADAGSPSTGTPPPGSSSTGAPLAYSVASDPAPVAASDATSLADAKPLDEGPNVSDFQETGRASWYGPGFHGRKTASGERYNMNAMTAAHKTLPLASYVRVTNTTNDKSVVVKINDRGPYVRGRVIDLSYAAARLLGFRKAGTTRVKIEGLTQQQAKAAEAQMVADNTLR